MSEPSSESLSLEGLVFETIELDRQDHVFTITLNRPARKNALNTVMINELIYALDYAREERAIRVVVLAAKGDVFCAGADLRGMRGDAPDETTSNVPKRGETDDVGLRIRHLNKPVIAKIQGGVLAGALLLVCNASHAIASNQARFSAPEIKRGIWPFMVMAGLFRLMPKRAGLDFVMRGEPISAEVAASYGLVNECVEPEALDARVEELAKQLAALAPNTMRMGLAAYNRQEDMAFDEAMPYLREQINACVQSADAREGITAFLEKRAPKWD